MAADASSRARLLVIDDEPLVCELVCDVAAAAGYDAQRAATATEIAARTLEPYDVVVLDLHLGQIDALDVMARVAETSPSTRMVLISGSHDAVNDAASSWARTHGLDVAADLAKPVDIRALRALLRGLVAEGPSLSSSDLR